MRLLSVALFIMQPTMFDEVCRWILLVLGVLVILGTLLAESFDGNNKGRPLHKVDWMTIGALTGILIVVVSWFAVTGLVYLHRLK